MSGCGQGGRGQPTLKRKPSDATPRARAAPARVVTKNTKMLCGGNGSRRAGSLDYDLRRSRLGLNPPARRLRKRLRIALAVT